MGETLHYIAFFACAVVTLGAGLGVVSSRNLFHSALFLLGSLFGVAGLFVTLVAPFLAAIQVLVYMGAIGILIIFGIMLTRGMMDMKHPNNDQQLSGAVVAILLFSVLVFTLTPIVDKLGIDKLKAVNADFTDTNEAADVNYETVNALGEVIADRNGFVLPFELASMLLTAAMIGAIVIAREDEA